MSGKFQSLKSLLGFVRLHSVPKQFIGFCPGWTAVVVDHSKCMSIYKWWYARNMLLRWWLFIDWADAQPLCHGCKFYSGYAGYFWPGTYLHAKMIFYVCQAIQPIVSYCKSIRWESKSFPTFVLKFRFHFRSYCHFEPSWSLLSLFNPIRYKGRYIRLACLFTSFWSFFKYFRYFWHFSPFDSLDNL